MTIRGIAFRASRTFAQQTAAWAVKLVGANFLAVTTNTARGTSAFPRDAVAAVATARAPKRAVLAVPAFVARLLAGFSHKAISAAAESCSWITAFAILAVTAHCTVLAECALRAFCRACWSREARFAAAGPGYRVARRIVSALALEGAAWAVVTRRTHLVAPRSLKARRAQTCARLRITVTVRAGAVQGAPGTVPTRWTVFFATLSGDARGTATTSIGGVANTAILAVTGAVAVFPEVTVRTRLVADAPGVAGEAVTFSRRAVAMSVFTETFSFAP